MFDQFTAPKQPPAQRASSFLLVGGLLLQQPALFRATTGIHDPRASTPAVLLYLGWLSVAASLPLWIHARRAAKH